MRLSLLRRSLEVKCLLLCAGACALLATLALYTHSPRQHDPTNTPGGDDGEPLDVFQPTPPRFLNERERKLAEYLEVVKKAHRVTSDNVIRSFQLDRLAHLAAVCHNRPKQGTWRDLPPLHKKNLLSHLLVNDKYKFLYCYTPKVACANWKKILKVMDEKAIHPNDGVLNHMKDVKFLRDYSAPEIDKRLRTYYKFTFVREPISRLVSAFLNKFREIPDFQRRHGVEIIRKYRKNPPQFTQGDDVTFEEFVRSLLDKLPEKFNEHWMPIEHLCHPCVVKYDFIGAYENLEAEANHVIRHVNASRRVAFPAPQSYYKPAGSKKVQLLYNTLTPVQKQRLLQVFSFDFEAFNYEIPKS